MNNPYGQCQHTKYEGSAPCIHDAYQRGRDDAAKAIHALAYHPKGETFLKLMTLKMAIDAARGEETDDDCTFEGCNRVAAVRGGEQE